MKDQSTLHQQTASAVMMIRPNHFGYNEQTASSNAFQRSSTDKPGIIQEKALKEFNAFADTLRDHDIEVVIFDDLENSTTPDSIFPNNWISFHEDGTVIVYPMMAPNRRLERRTDIVDSLEKYFHFRIKKVLDFSYYERENKFLEGTGSIVFDYAHQVAYANISDRTEYGILEELSRMIQYQVVSFKAVDKDGKDIYHTNVLMCVGDQFAVLCEEAIPTESERIKVREKLELTGHQIIAINYDQLYAFAGNMIQLRNHSNKSFIVLSQSAFDSLSDDQKDQLQRHGKLLPIPIHTIETHGGGSVRCMLAAIHLDKRKNYN